MISAMVNLIFITNRDQCSDMIVSVLMVDPAVGFLPGEGYGPYDRGTQLDIWVKAPNGSASLGVVWPGVFLSIL